MPRKGVSGSGGFVRPTNFTEAEARVLWENAILIPPAWHLPHGWNMSATGYAVPPIPEGPELDALIGRRWQMLPIHERELPENAPRPGIWLSRLQRERQADIAEFAGPHVGRYNVVGRRIWWQNRDVDDVLGSTGTLPPPARCPFSSARSAPTQAMSRSSSSNGRSAARSGARSVPYPPPARSIGIVIRDAGGSSSAPPRREKKEEPEEKEWEPISPELLEETRPWWVADREMPTKLSRHPQRPGRRARSVTRRRALAGRGRRSGKRGARWPAGLQHQQQRRGRQAKREEGERRRRQQLWRASPWRPLVLRRSLGLRFYKNL
jgi:hypothetical protein